MRHKPPCPAESILGKDEDWRRGILVRSDQITRLTFEQQFNLKLRIQNPNNEDLKIDGMAFDLEINDQLFAQGVGNQSVTVPRYGSGFMPVEAVSTLGGILKQFSTLARGDKPVFKCRIKGTLSVAGSRIPFERRGDFDLSALAPKKTI